VADVSLQQEIGVILAAPVVTLVGAAALIVVVWRFVNWAYGLQISTLREQTQTVRERLALSNDRLANSNDELAQVRQKLEAVEAKLSEPKVPPTLAGQIGEAIGGITASIKANTATITATGASYMAGTDRSGTPLVLNENPKPPS